MKVYHRDVDDDLFYADMVSSITEWTNTFNDNGNNFGKFQMWCKCNSLGKIRSYYYFDSSPNLHQFVNQDHALTIDKSLEIYSDNKRINTSYTRAGGEFYMDISSFIGKTSSIYDFISISVKGFTKYIKIPYEICYDYFNHHKSSMSDLSMTGFVNHHKSVITDESLTGYIMSLWTYDRKIWPDNESGPQIENAILGLAKHFEHHFCLLNITRYEVLVQGSYVKHYLRNAIIVNAVRKGHIKFVLKNNHFTQYDETSFLDDCKYYSVFMNLQILRYWTYNARLLFWDTDE